MFVVDNKRERERDYMESGMRVGGWVHSGLLLILVLNLHILLSK